jgi:hypothetical protein
MTDDKYAIRDRYLGMCIFDHDVTDGQPLLFVNIEDAERAAGYLNRTAIGMPSPYSVVKFTAAERRCIELDRIAQGWRLKCQKYEGIFERTKSILNENPQ